MCYIHLSIPITYLPSRQHDAVDEILREDDPEGEIPLLQRFTKKDQIEWIKQRVIGRWKEIEAEDEFPEFVTQSVMGTAPDQVLLPKQYFNLLIDNSIIEKKCGSN